MNTQTTKKKNEEKYICPIPKSTFTTFSDEGIMHFRAGKFRKALYCFDRALLLKPNNKSVLVIRSQCHLKLGDATSALRDAEASFPSDQDSGNIVGLYQYAEALFNLGQFEQALIAYHKGFLMRKDKEEFRIGVSKAQAAIIQAIGDRQATQIEDLDIVLPKVLEMEEEARGLKQCCALTKFTKPKIKKTSLTMARERWVDRQVLGVLQQDKDYLSKFLKRPDIKGNAQNSSKGLRDMAKEALNYLEIRETFWRQKFPVYAHKVGLNFNNSMIRQYEQQEHKRMEALRKIKMDAAQGSFLKKVSQIEHAMEIGRAHDAQLECDRALRQIKEISKRVLVRKPEFLMEILHYKGLALMKQRKFDIAVTTFQDEYKVATENKMTDNKSRALDFLGRSYALKGSYAEAAEVWEARLAMTKPPVERAYLLHEMGRCYFEAHKLDFAKIYGQQSLDEALKIADDIWAMNACILLGQVEIRSKSFDTASSYFKQAEEYAVSCGKKANVKLLKEGQHCIKIFMEKKAEAIAAPRISDLSTGKERNSEDSFDDDYMEEFGPLSSY